MADHEKGLNERTAETENSILTLALTGAEDFEIVKRLRVSPVVVLEVWRRLAVCFGTPERGQILQFVFGPEAAAAFKARRDLEIRLKEEILEQEVQQSILNDLSMITNTGGWSFEPSSGKTHWTKGINQILARPEDAAPLTPTEVMELVHPEDRGYHRKAVERLISEGTGFNISYRLMIGGGVKFIRSISKAIFDESGNLVRVFGTIMDETESLRLREAEIADKRMIETIAAVLPDTVYVYDLERQETVYANGNVSANLGYSQLEAQELGPGIASALLHQEDVPTFLEHRENLHCMKNGEIHQIEVRLRHAEGHWAYLQLRKVVLSRNSQNEVNQILTTVHDVTALRESEKALVESQKLLERSFRDAPLGIALISLEGAIEKVNPAYCSICDYSEPELIGQNIALLNRPEEVDLYVDYLCSALSNVDAPPYRRTKQSIRKDGSKVWVNLVCSLVRDQAGKAIKVICQIQDITASKEADDRLRESDERIQTAIDSLPSAVMLIERDLKVKIANPSAAMMLEVSLESLRDLVVDEPSWQLLLPNGDQMDLEDRPVKRALRGELVDSIELKLRTASQREIWIRATCSPLYRTGNSEPYGAVATFSDVTEEVELRTSLKSSLTRVKALNDSLEEHQRDLEMQKIHLVEANISLTQLAITDGLTGLNNSRKSKDYLEERVRETLRYGRPLSVAMIDVDHFKKFNDAYGHLTGDEILQEVSSVLLEGLRNTDFLGRFGGEEFIVVMPEVGSEGAQVACERLRFAVEERLKDPFAITISIGIATFNLSIKDSKELLELADKALYQSKTSGRNRVTLSKTQSSQIPAA